MTEYFRIESADKQVKVLIFDRPDKEVNVLSEVVIRELAQHLEVFAKDKDLSGLVITSGKRDFALGADISDITGFATPEETTHGASLLQQVFSSIAALKIPTVCAINGQCLGGGLELALACSMRIATDDSSTKLGLPEIQLGLIPGAGGTQRLPRLVGIQGALDLILTGKTIEAKKAKKLGLVDKVCPASLLLSEAVKLANGSSKINKSPKMTLAKSLKEGFPRWATEQNPLGRRFIARKAREMVDKSSKGFYPAPYKALDAVFDGFETSLSKGLDLEAKIFGQLAHSRESYSLVHLYHATTHTKKNPVKAAGNEVFGDKKVSVIGVIGAGFMGAGISTVAVDKGLRVLLSDPNKEAMGRALGSARSFLFKKVRRKRLKSFDAVSRLAHISAGLNINGFGNTDVVIEAVFEDINLKQKILAEVEGKAHPHQVFATNTSALPVGDIAAKAKHPERVLGMHFFSPVEKMPLLEIVVTPATADWALARAFELGKQLGKQIIVVKDGPGFYTTRALAFFMAEAALMLSEGARIETIDKALTEFGFPVGPITLMDEVGLDVGVHVLETMAKAFSERVSVPKGFTEIQNSGRLGRKNGKGFYKYVDGKRTVPDESIYELVQRRPSDDAKGASMSATEIVDRCVLSFVNESVRCLEEGILQSAYDGDVGAVFGLGFPPFWGGPFKYVDLNDAKLVVERLRGLADKYGARFTPAPLLAKHADTGAKFFKDER